MIYSSTIKKAMNLAYTVHAGQADKNGYPYICHPLHLAEQMADEQTTILALLHDVVEDTDVTFENLTDMGFDLDVLNALKLLTHDKAVDYFEYVRKIKGNRLAKAVKIADLRHNMDLSRLDKVSDKDLGRVEKYKKALKILTY